MPRTPFYVLAVLFSLIWSSAFIAGKIVVAEIDPFSILTIRFFFSALLLFLFARLRGQRIAEPSVIRTGLLLGVLNNAVYLSLTFSALKFISPGWVTIIVACAPFMTVVLAVPLRVERVGLRKVLGIGVGFFGVAVMVGWSGLEKGSLTGVALAACGTAALALGTVLFRGRGVGAPLQVMNFWQSVSGCLCLLPVALIAGEPLAGLSAQGAAAIGWLVMVTIVGMGLWLLLIRLRGASGAASCHLLNPVSALLLSCLVLGIAVRGQDIAGALLIGCGLIIVNAGNNGTKNRRP